MQEVAAFSSLAVTLGLVLSRPRVGSRFRVGPATAAAVGVFLMALAGLLSPEDVVEAGRVLWRPLLTITAIMVLTAAANRMGVLRRAAAATVPHARGSTTRLFALVFAISAATSATLNNDAAVLLLTPLVVLLVRSVYPDRPSMVVPFAFAVFMAAGVAPLVVSNPMNMVVAEVAGIGFNEYAVRMLPISFAGWVIAFLVLRALFIRELRAVAPSAHDDDGQVWGREQWSMVVLLLVVLVSYPMASYAGWPIWIVAVTGALVALMLCLRHEGVGPVTVLRSDVSWETLAFLLGALLLAFGLRSAGIVDDLVGLYESAAPWTIGVISSVGSAVVNNHPMALINVLAIEEIGGGRTRYLAALIGGDLGPRLLPIGSLAGLLWFASLRRLGVDIPVHRFVAVGAAVTIPTLAASLFLLSLLA